MTLMNRIWTAVLEMNADIEMLWMREWEVKEWTQLSREVFSVKEKKYMVEKLEVDMASNEAVWVIFISWLFLSLKTGVTTTCL